MAYQNRTANLPAIALAALLAALSGCAAQQPAPQPQVDPTKAHGNQLGAISYRVKRGDNLVLISADITQQRENWRRIADFNRIDNPGLLRVGQTIYIPRDLIPLNQSKRAVVGSPSAEVQSVRPRSTIYKTPLPE